MNISLCMIVKNEEENLGKCLSKVYNYVDEIIIVDTGSTDSTKNIAREYTDKVYDFLWKNDFSKARNFSISKAKNNWILILDADEFITFFDRKNLENIIYNDLCIGRIKICNEYERDNEINIQVNRVSRFFNKNFYMFDGIIHEQIKSINKKEIFLDIPIEVTHVGYESKVVDSKNKLNRNIELLNEALNSNSSDSYLNYQLGKSYYMKKNFSSAEKFFKIAIRNVESYELEYVQDLIETYGYSLINQSKYEEAIELEKFKPYYFNNPDYVFLLGLIYMNNGKFERAIRSFKKCIDMKDDKMEGVTSYKSYYNIGVIYEALKDYDNAILNYSKCEYYPRASIRLEEVLRLSKIK